ncbi:hypothetical protein BD413DRAFT_528145, partial [Trametes elegans]
MILRPLLNVPLIMNVTCYGVFERNIGPHVHPHTTKVVQIGRSDSSHGRGTRSAESVAVQGLHSVHTP